ncbi:unnamed protein product [Clonostachys byssicola]|uniref:Rhodopsin domain-containing protein n=1 Tax=Clonostachys byssicola TaxID=160290 RepID=A0A9N9UKW6_9HYPO|nr:unnamed protein product [Clonostachys byssicola]
MAVPDNTLVIYVVTATTFLLATILIVLRLVARYVTKIETWWDDWFALLAFLCAFGFSGVVIEWTVGAGLGRPLEVINISREDAYYQSRMLLWIGEIIYAFALTFSKLSVLSFYWRLFSTSSIRIPIQILTGASIVWLVIRTPMAIFHCVPVHAFWDLTVDNKVCNIDDSKFFFGTVLVHLIIDVLILALPVVQVKNLRLRLGQKIAVIGLFMFGILVCVASIGVLVESSKFDPNSPEMPLEISPIIIWATMEVNLAIISTSLPLMRPIFRRMLPDSVLGSDSRSSAITRSDTGSLAGFRPNKFNNMHEMDDACSFKNFPDIETGSISSDGFGRTRGYTGPQTFSSVRAEDGQRLHRDFKGIHVKNETRVSVVTRPPMSVHSWLHLPLLRTFSPGDFLQTIRVHPPPAAHSSLRNTRTFAQLTTNLVFLLTIDRVSPTLAIQRMPAPIASKVPRQAPALYNRRRDGCDWKACQIWSSGWTPYNISQWGQDFVCPNLHVRTNPLSAWAFDSWGFVTAVENAKWQPACYWIDEKSKGWQKSLPWMLSWERFQFFIKEARGGSFPEDLVLRLPCVEDPLKASTEFDWRMSMAAAEFFVANDHRMWCGQQPATIVVCRAKEFRTLVDQGWEVLMRKLKEGKIGDANGEAQSEESDSTADSNVAEGHDLQAKDRNSSTEEVADATAGDSGDNAATETTTTTTTTVDNSTTTTTVATVVAGDTTMTTTIITATVGGDTTTTTSIATTSKKRKNITQAQSRDGGNNKRPRGSTAQAEQNTATIDLEQEK